MTEFLQGAHCRICGSLKLNKFYFALDLSSKVSLYQILSRDKSVDELIRPCECRGDFAFAHRVCLADWIETTKHEYCDICRCRYDVKFVDKSIFDWIFETRQIETILKTLLLALLVYYVGSLGILIYLSRQSKNVLDVVTFSTSCIWIVISSILLVFHLYRLIGEFKCWKASNRRVVVEANKNPQLDSKPRPKDVLKSSGFKPR